MPSRVLVRWFLALVYLDRVYLKAILFVDKVAACIELLAGEYVVGEDVENVTQDVAEMESD